MVKVHLSANFAKSRYAMLMLHFFSFIPTQQYIITIKLHVNDLEAMHRYINSVTIGQARIKGHLSAQFVKKYIKRLVFVISVPNISIKQNIYVRRTYKCSKLNAI